MEARDKPVSQLNLFPTAYEHKHPLAILRLSPMKTAKRCGWTFTMRCPNIN